MPPDILLALILGILFTVRRLDVARRKAEDHPEVHEQQFLRWQRQARSSYALGASASLAKVLLDLGLVRYALSQDLGPIVVRNGGAAIFVAWLVAMTAVVYKVLRTRRLASEIGIRLR
jgi:hypothetical protein